MAYEKAYERINFVNNQSPSLGATNLNKIDSTIDKLDNRIVEMSVNQDSFLTEEDVAERYATKEEVTESISELETEVVKTYATKDDLSTEKMNLYRNIMGEVAETFATKDELAEVSETVTEIATEVSKGKADVILANAQGESIHATDTTDNKAVEFALLGKATQKQYSGKNLVKTSMDIMKEQNTAGTWNGNVYTLNGGTFAVNDDFSITINGTFTADSQLTLNKKLSYEVNSYVLSSGVIMPSNVSLTAYKTGGGISVPSGYSYVNFNADVTQVYIYVKSGVTLNNITIYPMLRLASVTDSTYEPYVGGIPSPNPDYPQEIEVSGESYNLLENIAVSKDTGGGHVTVNDDKSITINGTFTAKTYYNIDYVSSIDDSVTDTTKLVGEKLIASISDVSYSDIYMSVGFFRADGTFETINNVNTNIEFEYPSTAVKGRTFFVINPNTYDNLTFYPMIRKSSVKNDRYMPYGVGSVEVKSVRKNLLKNTGNDKTIIGVTFTVNEDGSVTANGTNLSTQSVAELSFYTKLKKGTYKFNGCKGSESESQYYLLYYDNTNAKRIASIYNNSDVEAIIEKDIEVKIMCRVAPGVNVNNVTFYPMIRLASDTDGTYQPYKESTTIISTPNGLSGINGVCDEKRKYADGTGQYIQRVSKLVLDGTRGDYNASVNMFMLDVPDAVKLTNDKNMGLCTHYVYKGYSNANMPDLSFKIHHIASSNQTILYIKNTAYTDKNAWLEALSKEPVTVWYMLEEPIITDLSAEGIAELEAVGTFYPTTNILNDAGCGMEVTYKADTKNYIDRIIGERVSALETALINNI